MKELSELVLTLIEYIVLGGIAALVLAYAFIWINPFRTRARDYYDNAKSLLLGPETSPTARAWVGGVLAVGLLYAAGSLTNSMGYWLLEPAHNADLASFYWWLGSTETEKVAMVPPDCRPEVGDGTLRLSWLDWLLLDHILWGRQGTPCHRLTYTSLLDDEARWRTKSPQSAADGLDHLLKHIRLSRGVALCSLCLAILAIPKAACAIGMLFSQHRFPRLSKKLYNVFIAVEPSAKITSLEMTTTKRTLVVYLVTLILGAGLYVAAAKSWMASEREYHGLAYFGAAAAKEMPSDHAKPHPD